MVSKKLKTKYNYDRIGEFCEGMAVVCLHDKYGFIDVDGNEIIPPIYDFASNFQNGTANVKFNNKWRMIDRCGKTVAIQEENKSPEKEVVPEKGVVSQKEAGYKKIHANYEQFKLKGKWGLKDMSGKEILPPIYDAIKEFRDDLIQVKSNRHWGLVDLQGKEIIPPVYDAFKVFSNNVLLVKSNRKWGLANMSGKEIVAPKYDEITKFVKGHAKVKLDEKWGLIDKSGTEIVAPTYYSSDSLFKSVFGGFVDESGNKKQFEWD